MPHHAVSLRVTPCLRIECQFWLDDDGWNGNADELHISVRAASFAQAKADMELALARHIEALLLRDRNAEKAGQAAA